MCGGGLILLYVIILSTSIGTSMPELFYGEWGIVYTNHVVQPLLTILHDMTITTIGTLVGWGVLGLLVYFVLEYMGHTYQKWSRAEHDIAMNGRQVVPHPARKYFFTAALWRLGVLLIFSVLFIFGAQVPIYRLSLLAPDLVLGGRDVWSTVRVLLPLIAEFALFAHLIVVFLRLFMMRVRIFE